MVFDVKDVVVKNSEIQRRSSYLIAGSGFLCMCATGHASRLHLLRAEAEVAPNGRIPASWSRWRSRNHEQHHHYYHHHHRDSEDRPESSIEQVPA
jgi:poly(3-hydroxyalkanoate) synthetase